MEPNQGQTQTPTPQPVIFQPPQPEPQPSSNKKFLVIFLLLLALVFVSVGTFLILSGRSKNIPADTTDTSLPQISPTSVVSEEEKELESLEVVDSENELLELQSTVDQL
ncbi:hypothetical protein A2954_04620 [Candidatus Roizmanbacteria bacterium RIFCSPLOWO2_01_FULL_37_12]|uniref:Uncharacterized protein n=1 Tax=Candidatus Roizmanbacteria bacterium RIFCSPLOWO2_01_FULL_37_12 TaxID=1802056 RepID=A0A1F7IFX5_9BACT|nr:MAG: hypothetical protein A3D76_01270 [Candidatus Roizmanbacteria bacterium RIFCSPHIGHO2_02_FULL_37_9b]OGK42265.1 MAG: hypothetical protein A2954_04620 [Candidatus Roizmanbacteria bacterium RIFCSPLOWO2_01_FULL_37_12]